MICTFFGHKNTSDSVKPKLYEVLTDLILNHQADLFYVGNQGRFDSIVRNTLKELKEKFPHIRFYVVLAYMPKDDLLDGFETIYPEGLESVPPNYAIDRRNRWLVEKADTVITCVSRPFGGASKFKELAQKKNKQVINII